jgi:hypothetical protein
MHQLYHAMRQKKICWPALKNGPQKTFQIAGKIFFVGLKIIAPLIM